MSPASFIPMSQSRAHQHEYPQDESCSRTPNRKDWRKGETPNPPEVALMEYERLTRRNVRLLHSQGASVRWLAEFFELPPGTIHRIVRGR